MRLAAVLAMVAGAAAAQEGGPHELASGLEVAGWEGVGRLDIDGKGFCTGTLIAPDLVLTAAHCLFDRDGGGTVEADRIVFRAGLRGGRAAAERGVRRAMAHPGYVYDPGSGATGSRTDIALLELAQPIRVASIAPFATGTAAGVDAVSVVSYAADRAEAPALQDGCGVLGEEGGVLVMTCEVDFGSSGAPVFDLGSGVPRIVSVISAKAELGADRVALGASLDGPLQELEAAFGTAQGTATLPQVRSLSAGERADTGARFVAAEGATLAP